MRARSVIGGLLMMASITLIVQAFRLTDHRTVALTSDNVIFYICIAVGFSTLVVSGLGAWQWDEVPGNKLIRLARVFAILFAAILLYGLGPIMIISALHRDSDWLNAWYGLTTFALLLWEIKETVRKK